MCGNVTLLGRLEPREKSAFPERARRLLGAMLRVSQMRGAQSGGGAIQVRRGTRPGQVLEKCMNSKRGDLAERLAGLLARAAGQRPAFGHTFVAQTHVRFATAGLSSAHEAHPFCYVDAAKRGPRRILRWIGGRPTLATRPVETTLTHNGDMDALRFRGTRLPYPELGLFLERVLGAPNRWTGDSPLLAGALELFVTQGMWLESLRLAYHLTIAPAPPELAQLEPELEGQRPSREARRRLASFPAPALPVLERWAMVAEQAWLGRTEARAAEARAIGSLQSGGGSFRETLAERLAVLFEAAAFPEIAGQHLRTFTQAAVEAFLDNDLYVAVKKLEGMLDGTFGCVVTSTLEPGCAVAFSRGQPLSLGFDRESGTVAVVSERAALKVQNAQGRPVFDERLDLDLCRGEIARVEIDTQSTIRLTLFNVAEDREYARQELEASGRMVPLVDNPHVTPLPLEPSDRAGADLKDIAPLLQSIRADWQRLESANLATANVFARALLGARNPRLLVVGVTNDLWLAQQFVHNLRQLFPGIQAEAKSSNEVLRETAETPLPEDTVVLAVSQSGQDFPTLGALLSLQARPAHAGKQSFFVLTGEVDTLLGEAVGQSAARGARASFRVFSNGSGFRPSEAATATVNATHHTFVELLLFLAGRALDPRYFHAAPHGFSLSQDELEALRARRDLTVEQQVPAITGELGVGSASDVGRKLRRQARRWTWHILEGVVAFAAVLLVLELNLQLGLGLEPSRLVALVPRPSQPELLAPWRVLELLGTQANVAFYAFLTPLVVWALRAIQGRPRLHRQGTRELLIGDTRYVHQVVWYLAKTLFSLSYGFASIKPYSADNQDELVLTHEPLRGTLALFGIPGAGRGQLGVRAAAASMTAKQFGSSRSLGDAGAEIVTIGHGPRAPATGDGAHLALPSTQVHGSTPRLDALLEDLFDSWERMLAMQVFVSRVAEGVATWRPLAYDRSRTKDQVFAPTTAAPVSAAALYQLLALSRERLALAEQLGPPSVGMYSEPRPDAPRVRTLIWGTDLRRPPSAAA
jgi:hypothetical protein